MRLIRPTWVHHDGKPIFSVDVHSAGKRFATGGQGGDSGRVVVWNWTPLLSEEASNDPSIPKMLCQMDQHSACVNCVRWSMSGSMLASAGDDRVIKIWKKSVGGGGPLFGTNGIVTTENWRCTATLQHHKGDILDLSWSPGDRWLMSCSIDNNVIIWDTSNFTVKCELRGHTGMVKGVVWDPVGKYLASQSSDKSVRVWRTSDWQEEAVITEPFEECGGTTHVLRLSWSPDGQYLVTAHAMNGGGPTAQIIEREGWRGDKDFVGHRKAVTCVRFNNNIMQATSKKSSKPVQYCCLAMGSRDCSLSVWFTSLNRPVVVIHDLFNKSVMDLSWSTDGLTLLACSWDGSVACLDFKSDEMGRLLTTTEKNALYERLYGQSAETINETEGRTIIENFELLDSPHKVSETAKEALPTAPVNGAAINIKKTETKIDKANTVRFNGNSNDTIVKPNKQIETITADGKRRVTPMFVPVNYENETVPNGCFSITPRKSSIPVEKILPVPAPNVSTATNADSTQPQKTNSNAFPIINDNRMDNKLKRCADMPMLGPSVSSKVPRMTVPISQKQPTVIPSAPFQGTIIRHAGKYKAQFSNNVTKFPNGSLHSIKLYTSDLTEKNFLWQYYTGSPIVYATLSVNYVSVSCEDLTLHTLTTESGIPVLPIISLPGTGVRLVQSSKRHVGVVTTLADVLVWDVAKKKSTIRTNYKNMSKEAILSNFLLTDFGMPIISLSNGKSYSYCTDLQTWLVLCNPRDTVLRLGMTSSLQGGAPPRGQPLTLAQQAAETAAITYSVNNTYKQSASLSFLETQLAASESLKSTTDLKHWMAAMVRHLGNHGPEIRLRKLLNDLLGPSVFINSKSIWESHILGIHKHTLLEEALQILRKHVKWQRIYTEYAEQLKEIKSAEL